MKIFEQHLRRSVKDTHKMLILQRGRLEDVVVNNEYRGKQLGKL